MPNSIARRAPVSIFGNLISAAVLTASLLVAAPVAAQQNQTASDTVRFGPPAQITVSFVDGDRLSDRLQRQGVSAIEAAAIEKTLRKSLSARQRRDGVLLQLNFAGNYGARTIERVAAEPISGSAIVLSRASLGFAEATTTTATVAAPVAANPAPEKPVAEKPVAEKPVAEKPVAEKPVAATVERRTAMTRTPAEPSPTTFAPVNMLPRASKAAAVESTIGFARAIGTASDNVARSMRDAGVPMQLTEQIVWAIRLHPELAHMRLKGSRFEIVYDPSYDASAGFSLAAFEVAGRQHRLWRFEPQSAPAGYFTDDGVRLGGLVLTSPMPGIGINSPYGMRRHPVLRVAKFHWGVDFPAPTGTPVYAAADGVVTAARRNGNYGLYIHIDHGDGVATTYGHVHRFEPGIAPGVVVKAGDTIAQVGRTGLATGPHLYFEVFIGDRRVDPEPLLAEGARQLLGADLAAFERIKQQTGATEIASESTN